MAENAVQIGVRTGTRGDLHGGEGSAQPSPHEPDPQAAARFGQALAQAPQAHAHQAAPGRLLSPFELLGAAPQADAVPMSGGDAQQTSLVNWLQDCASRLLVGRTVIGIAVVVARESALTVSEESEDVRWWPVDALPAEVPPQLVPRLDGLLTQLRNPR